MIHTLAQIAFWSVAGPLIAIALLFLGSVILDRLNNGNGKRDNTDDDDDSYFT